MKWIRDYVADIAQQVEEATPQNRDRYLDLLRVIAIVFVILGHWLVRVVIAPEGTPEAGYLLEVQPGLKWATLLWQVMPLFFLVGGFLNVQSLRGALDDGGAAPGWVRSRVHRLLRPTGVVLGIIVPAWVVAEYLVPGAMLLGLYVALIPLWFVAAYVLMTALTPATLALHERGWTLPVLVVAVLVAGALDMARLAEVGPVLGLQPLVSAPNFLLIWGAVYLLGHLWADGRLPARAPAQVGLAILGAAALMVMIGVGGWPLSMVPVEATDAPNNVAPPTVALFALALVQTGLVLLVRGPVTRALRAPALWAPVAILGGRMMTLFLWHQVVLVVMTNLLVALGWPPLPEAVDARWWLLQPLWIAIFVPVLAMLVPVVGRFEDAGPAAPARHRGDWTTTLAGLALAGASLIALVGLVFFDFSPWLGLFMVALFAAGYRLVIAQG